ncbi:MAG: hypothetical protein ACYCX4_14810 [Bacillota bacterium]
MIITVAEYVAWKQPVAYGIMICWENRQEYQTARRRIIGRISFGALKRIMEESPRPGAGGQLPGEHAV